MKCATKIMHSNLLVTVYNSLSHELISTNEWNWRIDFLQPCAAMKRHFYFYVNQSYKHIIKLIYVDTTVCDSRSLVSVWPPLGHVTHFTRQIRWAL